MERIRVYLRIGYTGKMSSLVEETSYVNGWKKFQKKLKRQKKKMQIDKEPPKNQNAKKRTEPTYGDHQSKKRQYNHGKEYVP